MGHTATADRCRRVGDGTHICRNAFGEPLNEGQVCATEARTQIAELAQDLARRHGGSPIRAAAAEVHYSPDGWWVVEITYVHADGTRSAVEESFHTEAQALAAAELHRGEWA